MIQVQMQMYIYDIKFCHFVNWTPHFCTGVVIEYDESFPARVETLIQFHFKHITRELVTRNIERKTQLTRKENQAANIYCYCQKSYNENEEMIGCDNVNCSYKWIHYS